MGKEDLQPVPAAELTPNDNFIVYPEGTNTENTPVQMGPNIKPFPLNVALGEELKGRVAIHAGDNITTDDIMPSDSRLLPYRSNVPHLSDYSFETIDTGFPARCREYGSNVIVGGENYGQGSSREHAALVPLYLGVRIVIAKSFARIHIANLINAGIMPVTFENADDYEKVAQGDMLSIDNVWDGMDSGCMTLKNETTGAKIPLVCSFTQRQKDILKAGSLLAFTGTQLQK
jgi:aconitate hydratase